MDKKNKYFLAALWVWMFPAFIFGQIKNTESAFEDSNKSLNVFTGMGINIVRAADLVDYINTTAMFSQRVADWGTAVNFFGGAEMSINENWGVKIDYSYLFNSYAFIGTNNGTYELFYSVQAPSLLVQRVIKGNGFFIKFGAGGGPRFGYLQQKFSQYGTQTEYHARGLGVKCELVGQTAFDEHFFGYIGGGLNGEFIGELKNNSSSKSLDPSALSRNVTLNYFAAGLHLGVTYYF